MSQIPQEALDAWQSRSFPATFTTVAADGTPNTIYTLFVSVHDDSSFVITDHYFDKTRQNIEQGSPGSLLFLAGDGRTAYQLKGTLEYHQGDEIHEQVKKGMPPTLPNHAAVILRVESVYAGSEKIA